MAVRIIPRLDIKGPNLVKGIHLEGLRVLGKPEQFARHYYENGADELLYMDVVASLYGRNSLHDLVSRTARNIFIPLVVGGGLRTVEDIHSVLRAGADKVAINTAAVNRPDFIREAAEAFGSSTILIAIEAIRQPDGSYQAYTENGRERTGLDVFAWAARAVELGAGEILITSIDREGTGKGFDLNLTRTLSGSLPVPVIAHGGAGSCDDLAAVVEEGLADAVSVASLLHYDAIRHLPVAEGDFRDEGNIDFLRRGAGFSRVKPASLPEVKEQLRLKNIECRMVNGATARPAVENEGERS